MEKIYNEDLKLISREYDVRTLFNNELEKFISNLIIYMFLPKEL